jgi:hypothetical protein
VKVARRSGTSKAIVALARRIAIVMHQIWITGEPFRYGANEKTCAAGG